MIDLSKGIWILDGAMGTMLQRAGMDSSADQNEYLLAHPEVIEDIHRQYVEAGSDIIYTPTFTMNRHRIAERGDKAEEDIRRLIEPARRVKAEAEKAGRRVYIALDLGPLGEMLEPLGSLAFEEALESFRRVILAGRDLVDLVVIETMTDLYEVRAAVLAAKENCDLPIVVSMSFDEGGRTFTGTSLKVMAVTLEGLGVDAMGINCSLGPAQILPMAEELRRYTRLPILVKPNAGLPDPATGEYDISEEEFVGHMKDFLRGGAGLAGGCCGTDPGYIRGIAEAAAGRRACEREMADAEASDAPAAAGPDAEPAAANLSGAGHEPVLPDAPAAPILTSRSRAVRVDHVTVIGERLNPTGKKRMKQALLDGDYDYVLGQAIDQADAGAEILDVNVGVPGLDEAKVLPKLIKTLQSITDLPLQIDSSDPAAIEGALRVYNGKPIVNSVNGEEKVMDRILPLVKKYGAAVIGLTLDEKGIPATAEERLAIAGRIVRRAEDYGIPREDVIIDCLTLTASAQQKEVNETLRAVRMVKEELGLATALGVSNVSFGLPLRPVINRTFLTMALENGLDLPIINPNSEDMMASVYAFNVLKNADATAEKYIERYGDASGEAARRLAVPAGSAKATDQAKGEAPDAGGPGAGSGASGTAAGAGAAGPGGGGRDIFGAIEKGMAGETVAAVKALLLREDEMTVVNEYMIPALDRVGRAFEQGTLFLPQMLQAATAAQAGFEVIKERLSGADEGRVDLGEVVIATVRGDIHDIGKNIVKVIMDNYGYHMIDLGKNVPAEEIVAAVKERDIRLVGLSALMTTTLGSMEETIAALRKAAPGCRVMVGGAVLTEDYAKSIGADFYCRDAMKSVEAAQQVFGG